MLTMLTMIRSSCISLAVLSVLPGMLACGCSEEPYPEPPPGPSVAVSLDPSTALAELDSRFLSFAVDTSQLVGGNWWSPDGYTERVEPYDFARPRLRRMAAALAPAYLRIGGSEADVVYYDLSDRPATEAPDPYLFVLNRELWDGACDFARELGLEILFTLNAGPGPRNADRNWIPDNARELIEYTRAQGCPVVLWELGNEINGFVAIHGADFRIDGQHYARDMETARNLVDQVDPGSLLAGPSSAFWPVWGEMFAVMPEFMEHGGDLVDVVTWHYYPQIRCRSSSMMRSSLTIEHA